MHIRTSEDFTTHCTTTSYEVFYRGKFVAGAGVSKSNFYYDGPMKKRFRNGPSNLSLNQKSAQSVINACLAGISGRTLTRCDEIDAELN